MDSTQKYKQQTKKLFSQLDESNANFMIGRSNHEIQAESRTNMADRGIPSNNMKGPVQVKSPQLDMYTLEENIVSKVRSEVNSVMMTVETRVQDAVQTATEILVIPRVELALKSTNASSWRRGDGIALELDQRDYSDKVEILQMTASNRLNSHTDLNRIDETRGNNTVERSDWLVNERIIDRQPYTHHTNPSKTRRKTFNNMDLFCKMSKVPKITRNCNMYVFEAIV